MVKANINHLRAAKICARSSRPWAARNGIDWQQFVAEGVDVEILRATGDPHALRVVAVAEAAASEVTSETENSNGR